MLAISLLDSTKHQVTNIESALLDIAVMIPPELLFMTSVPHEGCHSIFFKAVEVDPTRLFSRAFISSIIIFVRSLDLPAAPSLPSSGR